MVEVQSPITPKPTSLKRLYQGCQISVLPRSQI